MDMKDLSILVLDDVNSVRSYLKEMLSTYGFKNVILGANGEDGKAAIERDKIDLILADLHMAPTSGMEFLSYIRSHPDYKTATYVMLTADNTKEVVMEAVKGGVDGYLLKPLTVDQIQTRLAEILKKKKVIS